MEQKSKRDLLVSKHTAFVGDDTGLIKKVKIIAKRTQETLTVRYDLEERQPRKKYNSDGTFEIKPNTLNAEDN